MCVYVHDDHKMSIIIRLIDYKESDGMRLSVAVCFAKWSDHSSKLDVCWIIATSLLKGNGLDIGETWVNGRDQYRWSVTIENNGISLVQYVHSVFSLSTLNSFDDISIMPVIVVAVCICYLQFCQRCFTSFDYYNVGWSSMVLKASVDPARRFRSTRFLHLINVLKTPGGNGE